MQRLNRKKNRFTLGTIHPITIFCNFSRYLCAGKTFGFIYICGGNFYGLPNSLGFDIILWILLSKEWIKAALFFYIVGDVNVLLWGTKWNQRKLSWHKF